MKKATAFVAACALLAATSVAQADPATAGKKVTAVTSTQSIPAGPVASIGGLGATTAVIGGLLVTIVVVAVVAENDSGSH